MCCLCMHMNLSVLVPNTSSWPVHPGQQDKPLALAPTACLSLCCTMA